MGILKAAIIGAIVGYAIARGSRCGSAYAHKHEWFTEPKTVEAPDAALAAFGNKIQQRTQALVADAAAQQTAQLNRLAARLEEKIAQQGKQIEKLTSAMADTKVQLTAAIDEIVSYNKKAVRQRSNRVVCRAAWRWISRHKGQIVAVTLGVGACIGMGYLLINRIRNVVDNRRRRGVPNPCQASGVLTDTLASFRGPLPTMPPILPAATNAAATAAAGTRAAGATADPAVSSATRCQADDSCFTPVAPVVATPVAAAPPACAAPAQRSTTSTVLQAHQPLEAGMTYVCVFDEQGVAHLVPTAAAC